MTRLAAELARASAPLIADRIRRGIRAGVADARRLFLSGLGPASGAVSQIASLITATEPEDKGLVTANIAPLAGRSSGSRLIDYVRQTPLEQMADRILTHGIRATIPAAPAARFGALETLDRTEIESFRGIRNLIYEYLALPNPERPLSIAVFGPPGSGKSFGVAQVAKSLGDVEKIEFNVSQFKDVDQLTAAFHTVRDAVVRGRVPLVFFDEFDASLNGQALAWLKHFLAPMQDGKFMDGESTHVIGCSIFVFAGGTKFTFAEFSDLKQSTFKEVKGTDFVSRLRGFVDIRGTDRREVNDSMFMIRRAVLLRSVLERKAKGLFDNLGLLRMDEGVRRGFLHCTAFRHGARSMEAIIDMSLLSGREVFERACLPSAQQLELHVDATEFIDWVTQDVQLGERREELARAMHELFVKQQIGKKSPDDPSMKPWDDLAPNYRNDNLAQADDICRKLALVNCGFRVRKADDPSEKMEFITTEIEPLAEAEHERWNDSKRLQGYTYAPGQKHDTEPKTHPCLLPWADLPEVERDKDRAIVKAIPLLLDSVGFQGYRLQ